MRLPPELAPGDPGDPAEDFAGIYGVGLEALALPHGPVRVPETVAELKAALAHERARAHTLETRLLLAQRRIARLEAGHAPAAPPPLPLPAKHKGGHPGHRTRNDRLFEIFEQTNPRLSGHQRRHLAASKLARETATAAGRDPERERIMPDSTARDAIEEARRHRARQAQRAHDAANEAG